MPGKGNPRGYPQCSADDPRIQAERSKRDKSRVIGEYSYFGWSNKEGKTEAKTEVNYIGIVIGNCVWDLGEVEAGGKNTISAGRKKRRDYAAGNANAQ